MKKALSKSLVGALFAVVLLLCNKAGAQSISAQSDLYIVLQGSCDNYMDAKANDKLNNLAFTQYNIVSQPLNGAAVINDTFLSYCANPGFLGADEFRYSVTAGGLTDTATVYINVLAFNDFIFRGDADQNGTVENFDVLTLGLAYNLTGPGRSDSISVNALAWQPSAYLNTNPGAADCNGDGIINKGDMVAIDDAYGTVFPLSPQFEADTSIYNSNGIPLYIQPLSDSVYEGSYFEMNVMLGNAGTLNEGYGIAFTLEFDNRFLTSNSAQFITTNSWLLQNDGGLFFERRFQNRGEIEIALTRTLHTPIDGNGPILLVRMPIDDNIDGIREGEGWHNLHLNLKKVRLVSEYNIVRHIDLQPQPDVKVFTHLFFAIDEPGMAHSKMYPNPTGDNIFIEADKIQQVDITDITGRKIYTEQYKSADKVLLNIKNMGAETGTYIVVIRTQNGVSVQKMIVQQTSKY